MSKDYYETEDGIRVERVPGYPDWALEGIADALRSGKTQVAYSPEETDEARPINVGGTDSFSIGSILLIPAMAVVVILVLTILNLFGII